MSGIRVELELDDGSFTTRMIHAGETVAQFNRNVGATYTQISKLNESQRDLLGTLRDVSVLFGTMGAAIGNIRSLTTGWMGDIIKVNAEMQRTLALLQGMSRAADPVKDAANQLAYLRDMAKSSPFSLDALTKTFVQLKATGIDPMKGAMTGLVNAVAAMGGSSEVMNRAALAMSQMAGKGVVQMEELRQQLGEAVPRAAELMARSMGVTYGELIKAVSTGTVEAKSALELLNLEFQRTFAGAAADRMETFDGLIARLGSSLMDLKLKVGNAGFFEAVQKQIKDLVSALNSPQVGDFAVRLGQGLTQAITVVREAFDVVSGFKDEIIETGKWIGFAFAASRTYAGLAALGAMISGVTTQITLANARMAAWNIAVNGINGPTQTATRNMTLLQSTALALGPTFARVATGVGAVGIAISTAMPYLPLIAGAIMLAVEAWSHFSDKTAKAREEMEKFGASSRKAVEDAYDGKIQQLTDQLGYAKHQADYADKHYSGPWGKNTRDMAHTEVDRLTKELADLKAKRDEMYGQGQKSEEDKATEVYVKQIDDRLKVASKGYDADMIQMTRAHEKEQEALKAKNQSLTAINEQFQKDSRARQRQFYTDQLTELQKAIDDQLDVAMHSPEGGDAWRQARSNAGALSAKYNTIRDERDQFDATTAGIPSIAKAIDEQKAIQKIQQLITSTQASSAGMRAELAGASSEAAKLLFELDNSDKIPKNNPAIEQLKDDLREAIALNDELQKRLQGHKDFERDLENATKAAMEKRFAAEHDGLTDIEKIGIKAREGFYGPLTGQVKSAQTALDALAGSTGKVATGLTQVQSAGARVGESFKTAFGDNTKGALEAADTILQRMTQSLDRLKTLSGGLDLGKSFSTLQAGQMGTVGGFGVGGVIPQLTGVNNRDLDWVVRTVISEAGNQGDAGQQAVANVIKNRSMISGRSLSQIVSDKNQFEPWNTAEGQAKMAGYDPNSEIYKRVEAIVRGVLSGTLGDNTNGADSFANRATVAARGNTKALGWIDGMRDVTQIGAHTFGKAGYGGRAIDRQNPTFVDPSDTEKYLQAQIEDSKTKVAVAKKNYDDMLKQYQLDTKSLQEDPDATGSRMKSLRSTVEKTGNNENNPDHKDWDDPYWNDLKKAAQAADEADKVAHENIEKRKKAKTALEGLGDKITDAQESRKAILGQLADPYSYKNSSGYQSAERSTRRQYDDVAAGGTDEQKADAEAKRKQALDLYAQQDIESKAATLKKETDQINQSLMTEGQSRQAALANQIKLLDSYLDAYKEHGGTELSVTQTIEAQKAALRKQALNADPFVQQMREYGDLWGNFEKLGVQAVSSVNDHLAQGIMKGKVNFQDLTQSMLSGIIKIGLQWAESSIFKSLLGIGGMGGGGGGGGILGFLGLGGGAAAADSGLPNLTFFHGGGIIGGPGTFSRGVHPSAFVGAPRFHTGGMIKGMGIGPDEVPIIAKKGEGVFTPEQMAALGNGGSSDGGNGSGGPGVISIAPNITLHANGGTQAQNADLAAQFGKHIEASTRQLVVDELRNQMRPRGLLNQ